MRVLNKNSLLSHGNREGRKIALDILEKGFDRFLADTDCTDLKAEYLLPTIIGELLEKGEAGVKVLKSHDQWFGVTYKEDRDAVMNSIRDLIDKGVYPSVLYR